MENDHVLTCDLLGFADEAAYLSLSRFSIICSMPSDFNAAKASAIVPRIRLRTLGASARRRAEVVTRLSAQVVVAAVWRWSEVEPLVYASSDQDCRVYGRYRYDQLYPHWFQDVPCSSQHGSCAQGDNLDNLCVVDSNTVGGCPGRWLVPGMLEGMLGAGTTLKRKNK